MEFEYKLRKYLKKKAENHWQLNKTPPQKKYDSFIIVPAKAESKRLPILLNSISKQSVKYLKKCLIIIILNNSNKDSKKIYQDNQKSIKYLNDTEFNFNLCYVNACDKGMNLPIKKAGVGLARKIGADLILKYARQKSIICYTDADTVLSKSYLKKISQYYHRTSCGAAIVNFKHQNDSNSIIQNNIKKYEKFLLETASQLKKAGSPYSYVALGSCMTCTASAYISIGGMNRMKATEDFYFLQELTKHFQFMHTINDVLVYPSSRLSSRVYLGTGYRMDKAIKGSNISDLYFSNKSFNNLKKFLDIIIKAYGLNKTQLLQKTSEIKQLNDFLIKENIDEIWDSLINNVDYKKYISQFHRWFDGLKTIKFLKYFSK